ncbi:MAG TPA: Nramp family divalent metal transporter [Candidatus Saccharimonadia bacterium]|nr:Nramp family divalent metal transporter [Candidatus Saccharimonadia bacterium]
MAKKDYIKRGAELPAQVLDETIQVGQQLSHNLPANDIAQKGKDYWNMLGPGLTTGASDDDPSGIATYSQAGAQFGFNMLWLAAFTYPLMAFVQEMCARIGLVTGRGLAGNIRLHFPRKVIYVATMLLFAANAFNIGADLGAMAKGAQLLRPSWNFSALVIGFTLLSFGLQIFTPYARYAKYLKWLALVLFAYVASALLAHLKWGDVLKHGIEPHITFTKDAFVLICAILGTTISPYLFFWQTSQEVEEQILQGKTTVKMREGAAKEDVRSMRIDVWSGMLLSNIVMFFIIATCGALLFTHGITNIDSAAQAAEALRPFAGSQTNLLFAIGIIGTGLLTIPVLAGSTSYAVAESLKWTEGLYHELRKAHAFYGIIIISMLVGLGLNFIGLNPIKALIYSAVANGIVAPVVLVPIVLISSNKKIMGEWVNHKFVTAVGWFVVVLMAMAGIAAIVTLF